MSERSYFSEIHGWQALPGLRGYENTFVGTLPEDAFESSGVFVREYYEPAHSEVQLLRFNNFLVTRLRTRPVVLEWPRTRLPARRRFAFVLVNQGEVAFAGDSLKGTPSATGVGMALPGHEPLTIEVVGVTEMILFTFDQDEISPLQANRVPNVTDVSSSPLFTATYHFLSRLLSQSPDADQMTANSIRELLRSFARALVVESTRENIEEPDDLFERVKELVSSRSSNLDFGPPEIARELGVSTRSLQRAAERHGASVAKMLRSARADRARHLLLTRPQLNLDVVSKMSGFNSVGSMRRALLSTHGMTPKDVRAPDVSAPSADPPSDPPADFVL
ncbi:MULTISPECIES: helix-turn-helix domain-containing protein [unclassified Pseudoclavibacter]|uniref:helix-turn-helix domain-containing protein n=1 Tax=unclassified Pseudoclavibacter TaxID=2615177 RepID=UPI000CE8E5DF|nr:MULTISPECIES: helix-turn-helix domain-containing protein [unclassified Pseudoclavibacter]MBF4550072.1 AraC family transcriptional regulator [Pseudoclavibacter sp. VKM Ac-2888]PPF38497.1 hypothetical protein C5E05_05690 [Pseudoclavibacter sp. AY1H1]PPF74877.1 hypothetical protein C5B99_12060 [Pseudoclavibacter sp. Z016]PPG03357.1 hypothetical protein C5E06_13285 [Pseudoclavibacter sp. RFBI5]